MAENVALRHQILVLRRNQKRPTIKVRNRLFWVGLSRIWSEWRDALVIVKPDTVVRWQTHLGLDKDTPMNRPTSKRASPSARLLELPRVGGLHHRYQWSNAA